MLESIYYVISWACRRACLHCYDERFRSYPDTELEAITSRSKSAFPAIISHLPESMLYTDLEDQRKDGSFGRKVGRIILSGGEVLLDPVRTEVLYPVLEALTDRYETQAALATLSQDQLGALLLEPHPLWMNRIVEEWERRYSR